MVLTAIQQFHVSCGINRYCVVTVVYHMGYHYMGPQHQVWLVEFQLHLQKEIILGQRHLSVTGYVINGTIVSEGNFRAG